VTAVAFDTLKLATALRDKAKLTQEQAKGFATAMADAMQDGLATKADLATVRSDLAAVASDLAATEARLLREIEATKSDILKWVFGAIGFQTVIVVGAIIGLVRFAHAG